MVLAFELFLATKLEDQKNDKKLSKNLNEKMYFYLFFRECDLTSEMQYASKINGKAKQTSWRTLLVFQTNKSKRRRHRKCKRCAGGLEAREKFQRAMWL